jgi:two-component system KDP operon response regulator KdpE
LPRILIVDDDPDLLGVCSVGLTALGHEVWTAQTGADGLGQVAIRAPEVIVLDLGLPDQDGLAVCRRIRTWSDVPIVVLSADGSEDRKVDALDQGADDYMTKPFGMRELNARIRVALRHHGPPADGQPPELDVGDLHLGLRPGTALPEGVRVPDPPQARRRSRAAAAERPRGRLPARRARRLRRGPDPAGQARRPWSPS